MPIRKKRKLITKLAYILFKNYTSEFNCIHLKENNNI